MEKSFFEINTVDRKGNDLYIRCEGVDDKHLASFGGLDLHVKATKEMISDINSTSFVEKDGDYEITNKVIVLYLNEIGELIRNSSMEPEYLDGYTNIQLVEDFLKNIKENPAIVKVIENDNEEIKNEKEMIEKEEGEIFRSILESRVDNGK
jgi:hypothetical protein